MKITTENFLKVFKDSYIQTFDDLKKLKIKGRNSGAMVRVMPVAEANTQAGLAELLTLNTFAAGIFFTPNPCKGGRDEENVTEIKWVFVDMDEGSKEEMWERIQKSPLYPSMIIESKRSYHLYWRVDVAKANWSRIINGLIQFFDGDPAISSMNEVLRLPGFNHMKNENDPYLITVKEISGYVYTEEDLIKNFPYVSPDMQFERKFGAGLDNLKKIDIRDVLRRLGVEVVNTCIHLDGKPSSMMVNVKENYINRFSGKPGSGSTIDAVMYFKNLSTGQAIQWLETEYNIKPKKQELFISYADLVKHSATKIKTTDREKLCEYHLPWLNKTLGAIFRGELIVISADTGLGKSEFCINLAYHNALKGKKILYYQLEMDNDEVVNRTRLKIMNQEGANINTQDYYLNEMTDEQMEKFDEATKELAVVGDNIMLYNGACLNLEMFLETFKQEAPKKDLVVVDHLHYFSQEGDNLSVEVGKIVRAIRNLLRVYGVPVILVSHIVKLEKNKEPELIHLFGSSNIAKEANTVIMMGKDRECDISTVYVRKGRMENKERKQAYKFDYKTRVMTEIKGSQIDSLDI